VTKARDKKVAPKILTNAPKKHGRAEIPVTDKLRSCGAAMGDRIEGGQGAGRLLNNRAGNSHLAFRRRERAVLRIRRMRRLQKLASVQASVRNRFNSDRSLSG